MDYLGFISSYSVICCKYFCYCMLTILYQRTYLYIFILLHIVYTKQSILLNIPCTFEKQFSFLIKLLFRAVPPKEEDRAQEARGGIIYHHTQWPTWGIWASVPPALGSATCGSQKEDTSSRGQSRTPLKLRRWLLAVHLCCWYPGSTRKEGEAPFWQGWLTEANKMQVGRIHLNTSRHSLVQFRHNMNKGRNSSLWRA